MEGTEVTNNTGVRETAFSPINSYKLQNNWIPSDSFSYSFYSIITT